MKVFEAIQKAIDSNHHLPDYKGEWLAEYIDTEKALQGLFIAFDNIFGYHTITESDIKVHYTFLNKTTIAAEGWSFCNPIEDGTVVCWWKEHPLAIIEVEYQNDGAVYSTTPNPDVFAVLLCCITAHLKGSTWDNEMVSDQAHPFETRTQVDDNLMYELGR